MTTIALYVALFAMLAVAHAIVSNRYAHVVPNAKARHVVGVGFAMVDTLVCALIIHVSSLAVAFMS